MKSLLSLNENEARDFFLKSENYCSLDLPTYFSFSNILDEANKILQCHNNDLNDCCRNEPKIKDVESVNYKFFGNKDGNFAWRPYEIIHPLLYVDLVNLITSQSNWVTIKKRFNDLRKDKNIICCSDIDIETRNKKQKASNINAYWSKYEQKSISLSLDFSYMASTDISGCYESLYTHSISWALHNKDYAKEHQKDDSLLGNVIDMKIRNMRWGQTNGIPQGSLLMDFIAEIVLGYVDKLLSEELENLEIKDFRILRFRDDYRVFTNNKDSAEKIIGVLSKVLSEFNFKLNSQKTFVSNDIISSSIKPDKLYWLKIKESFDKEKNIQKKLLILKSVTDTFQNCGTLKTILTNFYETLKKVKKHREINHDFEQIIAILAEIWIKNPSSYAPIAAVTSKLLSLTNEVTAKEVSRKLIKKFSSIPNNAYFEIWMQRIILKIMPTEVEFKTKLSQIVYTPNNTNIFDNSWLKQEIHLNTDIIDPAEIERVDKIISSEEFYIFLNLYE